jgi:hypothetical protein
MPMMMADCECEDISGFLPEKKEQINKTLGRRPKPRQGSPHPFLFERGFAFALRAKANPCK